MKRTIAIVTFLAVLTLTAAVQAGHFSPGPQGMRQGPLGAELWGLAQRLERVAEEIGISDEQLDQIHAVLDESRDDMRALGRAVRDNHRAIREASKVESYDADLIAELAAEQGRLTEQVVIRGTQLKVQVASVLSDEQRARIHELRRRHRDQ